MTAHYNRIIDFILKALVISSLVLLIGLRIYAVYHTVPIVTWDDYQYRKVAIHDAENNTLSEAIEGVFLPNPNPPIKPADRMRGYHQWLVLGLKLFGVENSELTFQLVNLVLFSLQAVVVFLFGLWALPDYIFAFTITFLYLSSPILFGMNRWVITENLVFTGLLLFSFLASWLLTSKTKNKNNSLNLRTKKWNFTWQEIVKSALVAYLIGIFSTMREYASPSLFIISSCIFIGLIWDKRKVAVITFAAVLLPFLLAIAKPLYNSLLGLLKKSGQLEYFHPLNQWISHAVIYAFGPAMTIFLVTLSILILYYSLKKIIQVWQTTPSDIIDFLKLKISGIYILLLGQGSLILIYAIGIFLSGNRPIRSVLTLMMSALGFVLIAIYIAPSLRSLLLTYTARIVAISLIVLSWCILSYQLFFDFAGGKTYVHHPFKLEFYNHPIHLRPLRGPVDMHVCINTDPRYAKCPD